MRLGLTPRLMWRSVYVILKRIAKTLIEETKEDLGSGKISQGRKGIVLTENQTSRLGRDRYQPWRVLL